MRHQARIEFGKRLAQMRKRAGLAQIELAAALQKHETLITHVEAGRSGLLSDGLAKVATELSVSTDYLLGLTDDPTPATEWEQRANESQARIAVLSQPTSGESIPILEVASAAGTGSEVYDETAIGQLWFRRDWLDRNHVDPRQSNVITVRGESMEPTLPDGCSILVDRSPSRRRRRDGRIFVVRADEGLVVKRAGKDRDGAWLMVSEHPSWLPVTWPDETEVIGEVRWVARTL